MKKILERLLIFLVGVPAILSTCYFLPHYHFLALHIVIAFVVTAGCLETRYLLSQKFNVYSIPFFVVISLIPVISSYLYGYNLITGTVFFAILFSLILTIFVYEIFFTNTPQFEKKLEKLVSAIFLLIYPIYLGIFLSLLTTLDYPNTTSLFLLFAVFMCDSSAWFFGMTFGKGNRGILKVSPNKSIAGFIGGLIGEIPVTIIAYFFVSPFNQSFWKTMLLMLVTAVAAIVGDLLESIIKRSVNAKDSGNIIIGRGGMMDSIDSIIFAVPVFYFLFKFLF